MADSKPVLNQESSDAWTMYHGDSCEVLRGIPDASVGFSLFSPPFSSLYCYSDSPRDLGNSRDDAEFFEHFGWIIAELFRVIQPGRSVTIHCMDLPSTKTHNGYIGLRDFPGDIIRACTAAGFIYHSKHVIWKDPLIAATRTKAIGLAHKQIVKDSAICRAGLPDYLVTMRKPGENPVPIPHPDGFTRFIGENPPDARGVKYSHHTWRRYASPVWMDINQSNTLNKNGARDEKDEKHICPLQLDVIERALVLWSTPGDVVLSPFAGIGSEGYVSVKLGRKFVGVELKESYYRMACANLENAEKLIQQESLFGHPT